jgi:hypothetical protein
MFRFMQRFGRDSQARGRGTGPINRVRRRNHQLNCEALEGRQMLSGNYLINAASGKVLDEPAGSTTLGAVIDQYQITGSANQQWQIVPLSNDYSAIVNTQTNLALIDSDYSPSGVYSPSGATSVRQWEWIPADPAEQWLFYPQPSGTVAIQNLSTGKFLDDPNFSTSNLTGMINYPFNGGLNQQWNMVAAGSGGSVPFSLQNASSGSVVANGLLLIPLADGNDLIVDASAGSSQAVGGFDNVVSEGVLTGGLYQQWYIAPQGNGYVAIVNASNYMVMDQTGPGTIVLDGWYGGPSQLWQLDEPAY